MCLKEMSALVFTLLYFITKLIKSILFHPVIEPLQVGHYRSGPETMEALSSVGWTCSHTGFLLCSLALGFPLAEAFVVRCLQLFREIHSPHSLVLDPRGLRSCEAPSTTHSLQFLLTPVPQPTAFSLHITRGPHSSQSPLSIAPTARPL